MNLYCIGIDGGGSQTTGVIVTEQGDLLARHSGPATNFQLISLDFFGKAISKIVNSLLKATKVRIEQVAAIYLAIAGVGRKADRQKARSILQKNFPALKIAVENDATAALTGAFINEPGVVLIAGTGSICYGRTPEGKIYRSGGWGYLLGDEGSGFYIAQKGLIQALHAIDGRGPTTLLVQLFKDHFKLNDLRDIVTVIYSKSSLRKEIANLAPLVFQAARTGDEVAQQIILEAGHELGRMVVAVLRQMKWQERFIPLALQGGVFKQKEFLLTAILQEIVQARFNVNVVEPIFTPDIGSAILATQLAGLKVTQQFIKNLQQSC